MTMENIGMSADSVQFILCDEDGGPGQARPAGVPACPGPPGDGSGGDAGVRGFAGRHRGRAQGMHARGIHGGAGLRDNAGHADIRFETFVDAWEWVRERIGGEVTGRIGGA